MAARRYYAGHPPRCAPDARPEDGLDALLWNGREIGAQHRRSVKRAAERARVSERERERCWAVLDGALARPQG